MSSFVINRIPSVVRMGLPPSETQQRVTFLAARDHYRQQNAKADADWRADWQAFATSGPLAKALRGNLSWYYKYHDSNDVSTWSRILTTGYYDDPTAANVSAIRTWWQFGTLPRDYRVMLEIIKAADFFVLGSGGDGGAGRNVYQAAWNTYKVTPSDNADYAGRSPWQQWNARRLANAIEYAQALSLCPSLPEARAAMQQITGPDLSGVDPATAQQIAAAVTAANGPSSAGTVTADFIGRVNSGAGAVIAATRGTPTTTTTTATTATTTPPASDWTWIALLGLGAVVVLALVLGRE